jgi:His/Glu/Gln/Arg/opine family amino acid ABC transporter permease subunit
VHWDIVRDNAWYLALGLRTTLWMSAIIIVVSFLSGNCLAAMRFSKIRIIAAPAGFYIDLMRATPLLMIIFWFYFSLPLMTGKAPSPMLAVLAAMVAFRSAVMAEIVRGGLRAVPKGQWEAAQANGLSTIQVLRFIILPQAVVNMLPSLTSQSVATIKSTSLAYILGVVELTRAGSLVMNREYRSLEILITLAITYFVVNLLISQAGHRIWQRARKRTGIVTT